MANGLFQLAFYISVTLKQKRHAKGCLVKNGYPPQYSSEVFTKVMEQVENFEENADAPTATNYTFSHSEILNKVAEDPVPYNTKK